MTTIPVSKMDIPLNGTTFKCNGLDETEALAAHFSKILKAGDVVALKGDLGSGKTMFSKLLVAALGCDDLVTSPTFTLLNIYTAPAFPVYHFDFYRLENEEGALGIGADEYIGGTGLTLVEWPERVPGLLPERHFEINIEIPDMKHETDLRHFTIKRIQGAETCTY